MTATIHVYEADNATFVCDLSTVDADGWDHGPLSIRAQDQLNRDGEMTFEVHRSHPFITELTQGRLLRLVEGAKTYFTGVLDADVLAVEVAADEDRTVKVTAPGLLSAFEDSTVDPWIDGRPISPDRVWNWTMVDADSWDGTVYDVDRPAGVGQVDPEGWPIRDIFGDWIMTRPTADSHPAGDYPFRYEFELDSDGPIVIYVAADNTADVWIDGTLLAREFARFPSREGFTKTWRWGFQASAGTHHFGAKLTNWSGGSINPAGLKVAAFEVTSDGTLGDVLFTSAASMGWKALDLPGTLPGFTAVEILQMLIGEAQARDELAGWTIEPHGDFAEIAEFAARVGDTYRSVIDALCASHVDVAPDYESLKLHVWPKSTGRGASGKFTFSTDTDSLRYLSVTTDYNTCNAVQVTWAEGVSWFTDDTAIAANNGVRRSRPLTLANMSDPAAVAQVADEFLAAHSAPLTQIVAQVHPYTGNVPGGDFTVGDSGTVGDHAARCVGIRWDLGEHGGLEPTPEFDTPLAVRAQERQRAIDKMIDRFEAPASASILGVDPMIVSGPVRVERVMWSWSGDIEESLPMDHPDALWQPFRPEGTRRLCRFEVEINPENLPDAFGESTFELHKNGSLLDGLFNVVLDTGTARDAKEIYAYEVVHRSDRLAPRVPEVGSVLAVGGHVDGTITLAFADPL